MKHPYRHVPPIEAIERRLQGITDGLLEAVERGETSPAIAKSVGLSSEWLDYQNDREDLSVELAPSLSDVSTPQELPRHVLDLIQRRVAANMLASTPIPAPGQIISVERIITPRPGQLDAILTAPLYVLLDAPAEAPVLWHGWLVAAEADYASWWDFVLQEQDAPFDPEAAMVQLWNPVRLYLPMAARVVGQLSPARLQAVRTLARDFAVTEAPADVDPWPGRVASRTTSLGLRVTTGSPLGSQTDDRHRYQDLYFDAAEAIREPARLALRALAAVPSGQAGTLLNRLIAAAGKAAEILLPESRVAVAMSGEDTSNIPDLVWPGIALMRVDELTEEGDGRMEVTAIGLESLVVEVRKGLLVEERVDIAIGHIETIAWDHGSTGLLLVTPSGRRLELTLKESA
jgi:hypothetical protein